jgi:23S rRNA G2445 N2-methylase RlmL
MSRRSAGPGSTPTCYAVTFPGLEEVAGEEITDVLGGEIKRAAPGLVVFRVPEFTRALLNLKIVEDVFLLGWGTDELSYRAKDLEQIRRWTAHETDWSRLLQIHHSIRPKPKGKPTYHLVTQMTGHHGYRRADAGKALAHGLAGKLPPSWRYVDENAAVEIWLTIHGAGAVCGLRLSDRTMRHRTYKIEHQPASLRPTIAAAMVWLAGLDSGQVILDPMCGAGTILAEVVERARTMRVRPSLVSGGDIERSALRVAETNLRRAGEISLARWDATLLPLEARSIDRVICNPPFGKQLGEPAKIAPLYRRIVKEFDRVLRDNGRAVLLVSDLAALSDAVAAVKWKRSRQLQLRVLGQPAFLTVWNR